MIQNIFNKSIYLQELLRFVRFSSLTGQMDILDPFQHLLYISGHRRTRHLVKEKKAGVGLE